ncbi:MAG: lytic transglycosylase domain-containing protein [Desulfobacterales bacterium]
MVSKTGMTIRDYLARHSLSRDLLGRWNAALKEPRAQTDPFVRLLTSSLSRSDRKVTEGQAGLTAADYLARPVAARLSGGKVSRDALQPPTPQGSAHQAGTAPLALAAADPPAPAPACSGPTRGRQADAGQKETIEACIGESARKYNLPPELIKAVIEAESGFRADAVSVAGAQGLMQLMPATARDLGVTNSFDIRQNIDGGTRYLRQMLDLFGGDTRLALAAYNAGPGNVQKYGGDVPFPETRQYVVRVLEAIGDFT